MVSRVPTYATNMAFIAQNARNQATLAKYQSQVTTGFYGNTYDVYNRSVNRLLSFESTVTVTERFIETNKTVGTRMELSLNSIQTITNRVTEFKSLLNDFAATDLKNLTPDYLAVPPKTLSPDKEAQIVRIQQAAFDLMKSFETYLNIQADNRYVFSGGKTNQAPVKIAAQTLDEFQKIYDGNYATYADTRAANLSTYSVNDTVTGGLILEQTQVQVTGSAGTTGDIEFFYDGDGVNTITAQNLNAFADIKPGALITIDDTSGTGESGQYLVTDVSGDGRTLSLYAQNPLPVNATVANGTGITINQVPDIGHIDAVNATGETIGTIAGGLGTTGTLTFAGNTITAANPNAFAQVKPGQTIEITGTGSNNGTFYVKDVSADGKTLTLQETTTAETVTNGTGAQIDLKSDKHGFVAETVHLSQYTSGDVYFDATRNQMVATLKGAFATVKAGDTIIVNGTANNNGVKTVKEVSEDGKTIIFNEETPIVAEPSIPNGTGVTLGLTYPLTSMIEMANIDPRYDGTYTVVGVEDNGNRLIVKTNKFPANGTPETFAATGKQVIASTSYYYGDHLTSTQRIDNNTTIDVSTNAEDGAFEKCIRALGIIAQGNLVDIRDPRDPDQTTYGVDTDRAYDRVNYALELINDALRHDINNTVEVKSDLNSLANKFTLNITTVRTRIEEQEIDLVFFQNNIDDIELVDPLVASAMYQEAYNALQYSMAALAKTMNLSLLNFIS